MLTQKKDNDMSVDRTPEKGQMVSVGSDVWLGVCVEIAAQCYGYVACSEMARNDKAVIELAEDLRENHELGKLRAALEELLAPSAQTSTPPRARSAGERLHPPAAASG